MNNFSGSLAAIIGHPFPNLRHFGIGRNQLIGTIPRSISNMSNLEIFDIVLNGIGGSVPNDLGKLRNLQQFLIGGNYFGNGKIGDLDFLSSLSNCSLLQFLDLEKNRLSGLLPESIGNLSIHLNMLFIGFNQISGNIPEGIGNLVSLTLLDMARNALTGTLPTSIGKLQNLERLRLRWNNFLGLILVNMSYNSLTGPLPSDFGNLNNLVGLFLYENKLSGEIPKTLGTIPHELEELPYLSSLSLPFNHLEGEEPRKKGNSPSTKAIIVMILGILIASILVVLVFVHCCKQRSGKKLIPVALLGDSYLRVSYKELLQATGGFASSNLIGVGSFGSVYKGVLHQQKKPVAVKVLNLQNCRAAKSFTVECKALKKVRHRNLLKIITSCSTIDYQGNDFKALVLEFIPNGSLDSWLHEQHESRHLNFVQRLDIAIDVANAIDYLHHYCQEVIVHRDLKPTNVLLDDDMVAHVSDFGLAKFLSSGTDKMGNDQTDSSMMKGTIGYIPPEGDIYSYGILLLEMITGRRPTDGVTCGRRHQRVTALELPGLKLAGSLSPSIGNLTFLRKFNLSDNRLHGNIPKEVGYLRRLRVLHLSKNNLHGGIPVELANCSKLQGIVLLYNNLTGEVPFQLGDLSKLIRLSLGANNLVGSIPSSLGNLSSLQDLSLSSNHLKGNIPDALGGAVNLRYLFLASNSLNGTLPLSIHNLSSLEMIEMATNNFSGSLAAVIGLPFPNLRYFSIGENQLIGTIPKSISNMSNLEIFDIAMNGISGSIPNNLGNLKNLQQLIIGNNYFGNGKIGDLDFLSSLSNCSLLQLLDLQWNRLGGLLPESIGNLSVQLNMLYMERNQISGKIPEGIGNLVNLTFIDMRRNALVGSLPTSIGKLQNLERLFLSSNDFSGEIPSFIGNLSRLFDLVLFNNSFEGRIPLALISCKNMQHLVLSGNKLSGSIPDVFGAFTSLILVEMSYNSLTGPLPSGFGNLKNLVELFVSENKLSGEIPNTLGECPGLRSLDMAGNFFQGSIPLSFGSLKSLETLNLSRNNLSGTIPHELEKLPFLSSLNLSFNHLEGEVPKRGVFNKSSGFSIVGNKNLCGGMPEIKLPKCINQEPGKKANALSAKAIIFMILGILVASILVVFLFICCCRQRSGKKLIPAALFGDGYLRVSYKELLQATGGFASSNLIGMGSFGSVYKGVLHQQEKPVAVKVFNLQNRGAAKSFTVECKALRKVRHRNLLKIITSCSSIDYQGNDFKALVFEFIPNGSLDSWLHEQHESRYLNFVQRLDIAIDVANAIDYLHHNCEAVIVHCDLKPTNVLLDDDMVAHVSDFGLAKLLSSDTDNMGNNQTGSSMMKGTIGYVPPVSPEGDIYSYGILLLEMITGRRPTDGVICGRRHQRVIALNLSGLRLSGSISPSIGNLTFLRGINLSWNRLQGNIPKELGRLRRLRALYLYINRLQGEIPVEITNCSNLQIIILNTNRLTGGVPSWFGLMPWLVRLSLAVNRFTGSIPAALGNISSLNHITLAINHLEGRIPEALSRHQT
ncbi:Protein kinase domain - like 10 [Theobroma cacao]|nr:Protein kinase domain - like 10 [Theobroma cacao]